MPLLYGEGDRAFIRLQEEYIRKYNDPSLLLWGLKTPCVNTLRPQSNTPVGALASLPSAFAGFTSVPNLDKNNIPLALSCTNNGIEVELLLVSCNGEVKLACFGVNANFYAGYHQRGFGKSWLRRLLLTKFPRYMPFTDVIAVPLLYCPAESRSGFEVYERTVLWSPFFLPDSKLCLAGEWRKVYLKSQRRGTGFGRTKPHIIAVIDTHVLDKNGFVLAMSYPQQRIKHGREATLAIESLYKEQIFIYLGPNNISFGLIIRPNQLSTSILIKGMVMDDALPFILPPSDVLQSTMRKLGLSQTRWPCGTDSIRISGKQLGRHEIAYAVISCKMNSRHLVIKWEEHAAD